MVKANTSISLSQTDKRIILKAAEKDKRSFNSFIVKAALERAENILNGG